MRLLLDRLGISVKYNGYHMLIMAIELVRDNEERGSNLSKYVYPEIAAQFGKSVGGVTKSIRRAIQSFWNYGNRALYQQIVGCETVTRPSNAEFINALASYVIRNNDR